jgi:hypothetical protein
MRTPRYLVEPGTPLSIELIQVDGARVMIRGVLDRAPEVAYGGWARCLRIVAEEIRSLPPVTK